MQIEAMGGVLAVDGPGFSWYNPTQWRGRTFLTEGLNLLVNKEAEGIMSDMTLAQRYLALRLFDIGAVQFGEFTLKMHEKNPDAPKSPIFFNFRTPDNPKPGPLTDEVLELVGKVLYSRALKEGLSYDHIAGIPNAGGPLAEAFFRAEGVGIGAHIPLSFKKLQEGDKRRIGEMIGDNFTDNDQVMLIDDLITEADTKFEAIRETEKAGLVVNEVLVLLDREQGGRQQLETRGYHLIAIYQLSDLLGYFVFAGLIDQTMADKVTTYIKTNS